MAAILDVTNMRAGYGSIRVIHGISFHVDPGEIVVILGANGAGKTTMMKAVSGIIPAQGDITFDGTAFTRRTSTDKRAGLGIAHVPEGRGTLTDLSVIDNLRVGGYTRPRAEVAESIERWFDVFPRLRERRDQAAGSLSGGEQQMLAVARALMGKPKLVLLDEPSMGLAPLITAELFAELRKINQETGTALLVVEQNAKRALAIADRAYVISTGQLVIEGDADELASDDGVRAAYLGV
ncbi:ABC transporter ATP-binding protein [Amycolatopsis sp. GM8]|uniref:ABC transporter ATP-binding protein n=1 Tax=Amycolatopsis sp. GM8 TaxID=2896530 RepID=UPI001F302FAD|nr:ABC transporter ATP-binding protein [Amycolatopsis sp. GM8]